MEQQRDRRPVALGDLRVLPDELLCSIIDRLAPRNVARLACVSSVMYILCNEEPLWMNICLRDGGSFQYKGSWKKTFLYRQNLSTEIADTCQKPLQFDGFSSLFLYRRWYRRFTALDAFSVDCGDLERKKNLSQEEFYSEYDGQKPVLLTELANTWTARKTWTIDQLLQKYGNIAFRISQRSSKKLTIEFKDYVSYMELQHDEEPLYIFDDKFGEAASGLLEDYDVPHLFHEDFFDVLDQDQRPPFRWLIIGPERSGASWHVDPALTSAWNTLLSGRKRWAFYPPGKVPPGVTVHVNEEDGDVDIETPPSLQWWLDIYPLLADEDKPLECTQLRGETIYVPSGWWHCVLNLETTIAVTQNFVNKRNFEFVCLDMAPGHLHKGVCRAGLLAVQDFQGFGHEIDKLNYSDITQKEKRLKINPGNETPGFVDTENAVSEVYKNLQLEGFSYDIDFLSKFLDEERDHYNSIWSASNCIGQREMRAWLHKLWIMKPGMRQLIWKGACLALNVEKWSACLMEICNSHKLPSPLEEERFPVGTGSNPVYLVSDYVIKVFVEGGLESSMHSLGTELEFYNVLQKGKSPLLGHVPDILASGIIVQENHVYKTMPWDGKGVPDMIRNCSLVSIAHPEDNFCFGAWSKKQFECRKTKAPISTRAWAYLITKRCKGDILANLRDILSENDVLNLVSFLGCQLHNLHLLPMPILRNPDLSDVNKMDLRRTILNSLGEGSKSTELSKMVAVSESTSFPLECGLFIAAIDRRRRELPHRLAQWGDPIPQFLIEKVEEYIPQDVSLFLNNFKDMGGIYSFPGSLTWLHLDIMDDNIYMESCLHTSCFGEAVHCASTNSTHTMNGCLEEEGKKKWCPTHILDFSNLSIGDPINDLIPIYLDVLRGDSSLLKRVLASYGLPLSKPLSSGLGEEWKKFERVSYRAMCYCILHEENVLATIFSMWKDLRSAKSWEEVEEVVWGDLNRYHCGD